MPSDGVPSVLPERPIRPLPKRKLRERLSSGAVQTTEHSTATVNTIPLFYYPAHNAGGPPYDLQKATREHHKHSNETSENQGLPHSYKHDPLPMASTTLIASTTETQLQTTPPDDTKNHKSADQEITVGRTVSAASSIDGYDLLENTNNKKKRKIPSASDTTLQGSFVVSTGSVEMLELGSGMIAGNQATACAFDVSGSLSMHSDGISGSGRGRLGRTVHTRSPLRTLSDGNNSWPGRPLKKGLHKSGNGHGTSGIISNAIANAERLAPSGQENAESLLRHHSEFEKNTPIASKFTFTCGSQVTGTASWHDPSASGDSAECPRPEPLTHGKSTPADAILKSKAAGGNRRSSRTKSRRQLEKDLMLAAHTRRQAALKAYHHDPPRLEDIWICEFCEYDRIFGRPPKALIREYELKDRRLRQEEADRRRLLEKAKAKSRKGRKGTKAIKGMQSQSQDQLPEGHAGAEATVMEACHSHSTQSEGGYEKNVGDYRARDPPDILELHEKGSLSEGFPIS